MKVLLAAAEAAPFAKNGGLGDVIGSLPIELCNQGIDARVIMPKYSTINTALSQSMTYRTSFTVSVGWRRQYCGVLEYEYKGVPFYFVDNEYYFARPTVYGFYDEAERYAFFSQAVLDTFAQIDFYPDILHLHDWHTGMIAALLKAKYQGIAEYAHIRTLFTIHNLAYQGIFPHDILQNLFGMDDSLFTPDGFEFYGQVNFMKAGLCCSDLVNTVSETYSREIRTEYFGERLDGVLKQLGTKLQGIVNGIDYSVYNPMHDEHIFVNYHRRALRKRSINKVRLQELLGLEVDQDKPVLAIISRLVEPKGFDLVAHVLDEILAQELQLVVLGTGEKRYEDLFLNAARRYPGKVSANITFDDSLARKIYAGTDLFLMPSKFEPCGIGQLIAMRYGAVPIVRETGGLKDTVEPYNQFTERGCGFPFRNYNAHEMLEAIRGALTIYPQTKKWTALVNRVMQQDYSWEKSAKLYGELYHKLQGDLINV